jgi:hypothetical protein
MFPSRWSGVFHDEFEREKPDSCGRSRLDVMAQGGHLASSLLRARGIALGTDTDLDGY